MKSSYSLVVLMLFGLISATVSAKSCSSSASLTPLDTIAFDMSQAEFTTVDGISYMEFPVILRTDDMVINAVDYWFQFDLTKLTYVSTTSTISTLDVFTNYNTNNQFLSNTSSTTSINVYLPLFVPIMKLKFSLNDPCEDILDTDFYAPTTLINGIVSSYLFIPPAASPESAIQVETPDPHCPNTDVTFSYASEINGQSITSYAWDFGNGQTGQGQTATSTYNEEGPYTITLEATTDNGCVHQYTIDITVAPAPQVDFSSTYNGALNTFEFTNQTSISSGSIVSYFWEFGDGQSSADTDPQHIYGSSGLYTVVLTATSDLGCEASFSAVIDAPVPVVEIRSLDSSLKLYPNPSDLYVGLSAQSTIQFYIVDNVGKKVVDEQQIVANQTRLIETSHLAQGLYTVVAFNSDHTAQLRFLVQH